MTLNRRALFGSFFAAGVLVAAVRVDAQQSLSDLNTEAWNKLTQQDQVATSANPFATGTSTAEDLAIEDLTLSGVALNSQEQYALISGYLVRLGDRIAGFRVDKIEQNRVILRRLDEIYVLSMGGGF